VLAEVEVERERLHASLASSVPSRQEHDGPSLRTGKPIDDEPPGAQQSLVILPGVEVRDYAGNEVALGHIETFSPGIAALAGLGQGAGAAENVDSARIGTVLHNEPVATVAGRGRH